MFTFITNIQFLVRYDYRWIAKNMLDGLPPPTLADLQNPGGTSGSILAQLISEASELVMAAAAVGARYAQNDLVTWGGQLLVRIVSDLTIGLVLKRRSRATTDEEKLSQPYTEALGYLEALRRGERIFFNVPNIPQAGLPESAPMQQPPGFGPPLLTQQAGRYFGCSPQLQPPFRNPQ